MVLNFWYKLSITSKILLVAVIFLLGWGLKMSYYKYKYFKAVEKERNILINDIKTYQENEKVLINKGNKSIRITKAKTKSIDEKLKQDEEDINSSNINDVQLIEFLSKHGENTD